LCAELADAMLFNTNRDFILKMQQTLNQLVFDNRFIKELPADSETGNYRRQVEQACYSLVQPLSVPHPQLVGYVREVAALLDLSEEDCVQDFFTQVFSGNQLAQGMEPYAMCYGGHQFGQWAGQLGDGRAINLGEVRNNQGGRWAMQLKGAGPTPYSRTADGLAVLRSSIREFLCSEAMYHLGVPTTRALSLITTGDHVIRDMFYDGNARSELGAVVCRVAPSFIRFGSFEIHAARKNIGLLRKLVDYTIRTDFPHLGDPSPDVYLAWFNEVCIKTAEMIVHWQRVGFVHGVMNTDNMSILGLTIDYGPYGWLDNYDPDWTPNTTDSGQRRYRFGNQPQIAAWNLNQLANAIYPLIEQVEPLQAALSLYNTHFISTYQTMMAEKLGLQVFEPSTDNQLIDDLLSEINIRVEKKERVLVTTLTKRMSEDLTEYLMDHEVRVRYLHSDVDTVERVEIIRDLRLGVFDVLVGINLLREGLDIPEVSLVAILDADKEGFLRSVVSLIQTIGRAARNSNGKAILYGDKITRSMAQAIDETQRRREKQTLFNAERSITPTTIFKSVTDILEATIPGAGLNNKSEKNKVAEQKEQYKALSQKEKDKKLAQLEEKMYQHAKNLEFEQAARVRDEIKQLQEEMLV